MVRRIKIPGTPYRLRVQEEPTSKVDFLPEESMAKVPVVIEVKGGRSSTASAMRAARVMHVLEQEGGEEATVQVDGECATVQGQADRAQVELIAKLPFVKKITAA
jgi:hypothetical protein